MFTNKIKPHIYVVYGHTFPYLPCLINNVHYFCNFFCPFLSFFWVLEFKKYKKQKDFIATSQTILKKHIEST